MTWSLINKRNEDWKRYCREHQEGMKAVLVTLQESLSGRLTWEELVSSASQLSSLRRAVIIRAIWELVSSRRIRYAELDKVSNSYTVELL